MLKLNQNKLNQNNIQAKGQNEKMMLLMQLLQKKNKASSYEEITYQPHRRQEKTIFFLFKKPLNKSIDFN